MIHQPKHEQSQLMNRILASRQFAHAHTLKRILAYLVERSDGPNGGAPKEHEIAVQAMGRPDSFDPRTDPIVRVSVASIRDRLLAYFATEGRQEALSLEIPKGQYLAVFNQRASDETQASNAALVQFWKPYLAGNARNLIVYTEPLFFRDDAGHYFRDWSVNSLAGGAAQLRERIPIAGLHKLQPSFHYLSTGEVHCMLSISRLFHEMGVPVETRNSRISSWNEFHKANLILLGSPRTNTFLSSLQGDDPFSITADCIENRSPNPGEPEIYKGRRYRDGSLARMTEHALVTRRPGLTPGCAVTMIAANHGRAIEGAGHFLTLEDRVRSIVESLGLERGVELPAHFQMVMRVDTIDVDDEVAQVSCVASRLVAEAPPQVSVVSNIMAELGRKGGKIGGKRRLETLSDERRKQIASDAAKQRWDRVRKSKAKHPKR